MRPNFIFIFDELDKIEPHKNETLAAEEEQEEKGTKLTQWEWLPSSYGATRERQRRILALLSNLKHLFTTAKAKFIFIAGREMYDASLADVSDRHFFMGSIFNEVLYVPSFLRDPWDRKLADVTSMTEAFVCQFLMPRWYARDERTLEKYAEYLAKYVLPDVEGDDEAAQTQRKVARMQREKVLHEVYNFIVYLTYRSNGAPKKLTRILEHHITRRDEPVRERTRAPCGSARRPAPCTWSSASTTSTPSA